MAGIGRHDPLPADVGVESLTGPALPSPLFDGLADERTRSEVSLIAERRTMDTLSEVPIRVGEFAEHNQGVGLVRRQDEAIPRAGKGTASPPSARVRISVGRVPLEQSAGFGIVVRCEYPSFRLGPERPDVPPAPVLGAGRDGLCKWGFEPER